MTINSAASSVKSTASSAASSVQSAAGSVVSSVSTPVVKSSKAAYGSFQEKVQWYLEKWEDLVEEAKAERSHHDDSDSAHNILNSLSDAKVSCDFPGRLRLHPANLKGHGSLVEPIAQVLGSMPGVKQVEVSSLTGSILIVYDKSKYATGKDLLAAVTPATAE